MASSQSNVSTPKLFFDPPPFLFSLLNDPRDHPLEPPLTFSRLSPDLLKNCPFFAPGPLVKCLIFFRLAVVYLIPFNYLRAFFLLHVLTSFR